MPFTGNYEITLAGSSGANGVTSGGAGYTLTKTVRLQYGDIVTLLVPNRPVAVSAQNMPGGNRAELYINGNLVWIAGGGTGAIPVYAASDRRVVTSTALTIQGGNGSSKGSNGYVTYHTCDSSKPGQCYSQVSHSHSHSTCSHHQCGVEHCTRHGNPVSSYCHYTYYDCGIRYDYPHTCGHNPGDVIQLVPASPGTNYWVTDWQPDSVALSNGGDAFCSISLANTNGVLYKNVTAKLPYYLNSKCNLIVLDNTVCYYKR